MKTILKSIILTAIIFAAASAESKDVVVARVKNKTVTLSAIKNLHEKNQMEQIRKAPFDAVFRPLRDQKVLELLLEEAKSTVDLSADEEVLKLMEEARRAIELQLFLKRAIEKRITDAKLRGLYTELTQKMKNQKELEVSVIVVSNGSQAEKVLKELNAGKDFGSVAAEYSLEPEAKKNKGNVGYLLEAAIGSALGEDVLSALKTLKDNVHSKKSIAMKDGKHLIVRRGNSRAAVIPPFDQLKPQLKNLYAQKALMEYVDELSKQIDLKVYTMTGGDDVFKSLSSANQPA
ncbi:MAG: peptidylprolyl isomerase [Alphaproteobacteria bacterium]